MSDADVAVVEARRVSTEEARRYFEAGDTVVVSENGHEPVYRMHATTVVHTRETTTWEELSGLVEMWRNRYPNQRYYVA